MAKISYSETITNTKVMIDGLKGNTSELPEKLTPEFIKEMEDLRTEMEATNSLQEKQKADLKATTEKLDSLSKRLREKYAEAKKRVKMDFPQSKWREFGIEDKK